MVERFRDEIGDWRLCILSPYGGRVHSAWGLALAAKIRDERDLEADAIWSDDGIVIHLPDADEPPPADLVLIDPDEIEDLIVAELSGSALFGARFRENAARSLLIPRAYPGKRTPLWQQRLKSQSLLEVARDFPRFPVILETYRECLQDVLDLPALGDLLRKLHSRQISLVEVETPTASPFASSLLFDYVATYMYEGDTPNAERRAAALALDRDLLRELLGQEELRELIDPEALDEVEEQLQHRTEAGRAGDRDALQQLLRNVGDLTAAECEERVTEGYSAASMLEKLVAERRVAKVRIAGEERYIAAEDAGLYRDALGVPPPAGLPETFLEDHPDAMRALVRRYARTHGPFPTARLAARYGVDPTPALRELEREGAMVRGELLPEGTEREWCDSEVLRRVRRASLARLRREVEAADRDPARPLPAELAERRRLPPRRRRPRPPARGAGAAAGRRPDPEGLGGGRAAAPARRLLARLARRALHQRRAGLGRRRRPRPQRRPRRPLLPRGRPPRRPAAGQRQAGDARRARSTRRSASASPPAPPSGSTCSPTSTTRPRSCTTPSGTSPGRGEVTNDAFSPLRAPRLRAVAPPERHGRRFARRRSATGAAVQGRWSLTAPLFANAPGPGARLRAQAELMLERYGIVTRETVLAEGIPGGFSTLYAELGNLELLGTARRGYFVEGLGGAQFALPGAVERLRSLPDEPTAPTCCSPPPTPPTPTAPRCPGRSWRAAAAPAAPPAPTC